MVAIIHYKPVTWATEVSLYQQNLVRADGRNTHHLPSPRGSIAVSMFRRVTLQRGVRTLLSPKHQTLSVIQTILMEDQRRSSSPDWTDWDSFAQEQNTSAPLQRVFVLMLSSPISFSSKRLYDQLWQKDSYHWQQATRQLYSSNRNLQHSSYYHN